MSTELKNAEAFVQRLKSDESFRKSFGSDQISPEGVIERAKAEGYQFTETELKKAIHGGASSNGGESLSEDELGAITGGFSWLVPALVKMGLVAVGGIGASIGSKTVKEALSGTD